jgi:cytochrome c-type biogenesis protein CcmH/NrfG
LEDSNSLGWADASDTCQEAEKGENLSEEQDQSQQAAKKGRSAKAVQEQAQALGPQKSYWPFGLAVALIILLVGIIINPIVLGIGVVLSGAAIIGWGLELRKKR